MHATNLNYPAVFGDYFKTFGSEVHFNDVTLVSDDFKQFPAHRVILSAGSTVLRKLLLINTNSLNPVLYLKGVKNEELKSVLQFLYLGEAKIPEERVSEFMKAAQELELKDLSSSTSRPPPVRASPAPPPRPPPPVRASPTPPASQSRSFAQSFASFSQQESEMMPVSKRVKVERIPAFKDPSIILTPASGSGNIQFQNQIDETLLQQNNFNDQQFGEDISELNEFISQTKQAQEEILDDPAPMNQLDPYVPPEEVEEKPILKCFICQEGFKSETILAQHKKKMHKNVLFHCARCRFQTKDESMFSQHMKSDHSSNNPNQTYRCVLCEYQATKPDDLKLHLKTHNKRTVILNSANNSVEFQ